MEPPLEDASFFRTKKPGPAQPSTDTDVGGRGTRPEHEIRRDATCAQDKHKGEVVVEPSIAITNRRIGLKEVLHTVAELITFDWRRRDHPADTSG